MQGPNPAESARCAPAAATVAAAVRRRRASWCAWDGVGGRSAGAPPAPTQQPYRPRWPAGAGRFTAARCSVQALAPAATVDAAGNLVPAMLVRLERGGRGPGGGAALLAAAAALHWGGGDAAQSPHAGRRASSVRGHGKGPARSLVCPGRGGRCFQARVTWKGCRALANAHAAGAAPLTASPALPQRGPAPGARLAFEAGLAHRCVPDSGCWTSLL